MTHYVCKECGGVSDTAKSCDTETCAMKGEALQACECTDGQHGKEA